MDITTEKFAATRAGVWFNWALRHHVAREFSDLSTGERVVYCSGTWGLPGMVDWGVNDIVRHDSAWWRVTHVEVPRSIAGYHIRLTPAGEVEIGALRADAMAWAAKADSFVRTWGRHLLDAIDGVGRDIAVSCDRDGRIMSPPRFASWSATC